MPQLSRCPWAFGHEASIVYHDREWGVPCWDDTRQFEFLMLESAQAGLSWRTILDKRAGYRQAFAGFDPVAVAAFSVRQEEELLANPAIIRNRQKIQAAINNAHRFLEVQARYGNFCNYLWSFVDGRPLINTWREVNQVPAQTALSQKIAKDMKSLGFKFLGPVIIYAHLQATGLINDHLVGCFRHKQVGKEKIVRQSWNIERQPRRG